MPGRACSSNNFDLAPGGCDLFFRRFAERVSLNGERDFQFTIAQDFHGVALGAQDADAKQQLRRNGGALFKAVQFFDVNDGVGRRTGRDESTLRKTAVQRHLAAFKSRAARIAAAGLLALVAGAGSLTQLRAHATADANLAVARAAGRLQIRKRRFLSHSEPQQDGVRVRSCRESTACPELPGSAASGGSRDRESSDACSSGNR